MGFVEFVLRFWSLRVERTGYARVLRDVTWGDTQSADRTPLSRRFASMAEYFAAANKLSPSDARAELVRQLIANATVLENHGLTVRNFTNVYGETTLGIGVSRKPIWTTTADDLAADLAAVDSTAIDLPDDIPY